MSHLLASLDNKETLIEIWHDCYLSESKITGFVCTFYLKNKRHQFYGLNDLNYLVKEAKKRNKDVYLSLNAFEYGSRTTSKLKQIRNIGVDIDCYKLNISVEDALEEVKSLIYAAKIPNPNLVIYSGRGIQLIYSISGGASPKMAFLTQYITTQFIGLLEHIGADTSGTDVTRVFRLPYSINSKNDEQVKVDIWNRLEYHLEELYSYCTPLESRRKPSKKQKGQLVALPSKRGIKTLYSLNTARKNDLESLVAIRLGEIEKRNVLTYIYAYTVALLLKNKDQTLAFTHQLNDRFVDPQKKNEVNRTAGNAYGDAMTFFDEFVKRDCKMWYKQGDGIKKPMKSQTVIDELDITSSEMQQLETIIDAEVKYSRKVKKRREQGTKERDVYLQEAESRRQKAVELKAAGYKYKQIAEELNVSLHTIKSYFRKKV